MNANEIPSKASFRLNRIKKTINVVRFLLSATIISVTVFGLVFLADLAGAHIMPRVKISFSQCLTYTAPFKIPVVVFVLLFLRAVLFFTGTLILFWLLDLFEAGMLFTAQTVRYFKLLGVLVLGDWVVVRLLDLQAKILTLDPRGLVVGLLIVLLAWVMDEGRQIQEEQDLTV